MLEPPFDPGSAALMTHGADEFLLLRRDQPRAAAVYSSVEGSWRSLGSPPDAVLAAVHGPVGSMVLGRRCAESCSDGEPAEVFVAVHDPDGDQWRVVARSTVDDGEMFAESAYAIGTTDSAAFFAVDDGVIWRFDREGSFTEIAPPDGVPMRVCLDGERMQALDYPPVSDDVNWEELEFPLLKEARIFERSGTGEGPWVRVDGPPAAPEVRIRKNYCGGSGLVLATDDAYVVHEDAEWTTIPSTLDDAAADSWVPVAERGLAIDAREELLLIDTVGITRVLLPVPGLLRFRSLTSVGGDVVLYERFDDGRYVFALAPVTPVG